MEEREVDGAAKALSLIQHFGKEFRSIDFTSHPGDIPGEAAGKGSNLAWAARKLSAKYAMAVRRDVIVTGIDGESASCLPLVHFSRLRFPPSLCSFPPDDQSVMMDRQFAKSSLAYWRVCPAPKFLSLLSTGTQADKESL